MSNIQKNIAEQADLYSKIVVPMTTRGIPLKDYESKPYEFSTNPSPLKPRSLIGPIPTSTRVEQKNNNIFYN
jgi:hypothetical protein